MTALNDQLPICKLDRLPWRAKQPHDLEPSINQSQIRKQYLQPYVPAGRKDRRRRDQGQQDDQHRNESGRTNPTTGLATGNVARRSAHECLRSMVRGWHPDSRVPSTSPISHHPRDRECLQTLIAVIPMLQPSDHRASDRAARQVHASRDGNASEAISAAAGSRT